MLVANLHHTTYNCFKDGYRDFGKEIASHFLETGSSTTVKCPAPPYGG